MPNSSLLTWKLGNQLPTDKLLAAYEDPDTTEADWDTLAEQYEEAFENVMDFAEYDNVLPELKERCEAVLAKMQVLTD